MFSDCSSFKSPLVSALAWSCFSPPLLNSIQSGGRNITTPQLSLNTARRDWLNTLDHDDQPLRRYLHDHCHSKRLGLVFESLWHFFLREDPATELIAHNIPVRDGNTTLGEFDVLYYCHHTGQAIHLELAVKFFLNLNINQQAASLKHWFGPNRADRLDRKLARLTEHQLPLANTDAGRDTLRQYNIEKPAQQLQISGMLFYPRGTGDQQQALNPHLNPLHQRGYWQTLSEFIAANQTQPQLWRYLAKPSWLENHFSSAHELSEEQLNSAQERPIMIINAAEQRCFLVPDHWPTTP
ncbi:MAG: DUF1853 family protein [Zhongshania sp.]|uniref:DUF1853 family protein n=1 Tax=Zhongshania sp. TaxID=1971902 RepID=UPI00261761DB|nr:DUF1853 family protein [Zhongshania sp.]MDF1693979.1 DUF1853 family protein [Zhongshania sp.]